MARTGEDGFVSVLGSVSRDLQLLRTDKVRWDFLQWERRTMSKAPLLLLVSSRHCRAGPPGNERLTLGCNSIAEMSALSLPQMWWDTFQRGHLGRKAWHGRAGQAFQGHKGDLCAPASRQQEYPGHLSPLCAHIAFPATGAVGHSWAPSQMSDPSHP